MKKVLSTALLISCFFVSSIKAFASCSNEEIVKYNQEAANVKLSTEVVKEEDKNVENVTDVGNTYTNYIDNFKTSANNLTENLYVIVKNDYNDKVVTFTKNGITSMDFYEHDKVVNLTYEIYTSSSTACPGQKLLTNYAVIPVFNKFSNTQLCQSNSDEPFCAEYVTKNYTQDDYEKFSKKITKQIEEQAKKNKEDKDNKDYKYIIAIAGAMLLVAATTATIIVIKKRKGRVL